MDFHAVDAKVREAALRGDGHGFDADDVARPAWRVDLAGGDHRSDAAMQRGIDPVKLALARRPVASDRMDVAVDESRRQRYSVGVDCRGRAGKVDIAGAADR